MSVYVITGVSKGLGFEMVRQTSEDPSNLIIGLVRDKATTEKKVAAELGDRSNIYVLHGDLTSYASLKQAAAETAKIVGDRGVDYLVANGAFLSFFDVFNPLGELAEKVEELEDVAKEGYQTNVIGNIHLFNLFLPLIRKGNVKKVIAITSGHADLDLINEVEIDTYALYAASKAAMNVIVAKFSAQYKKDGVLFVSMSPAVVDVGHFQDVTPEQSKSLMEFMGKIQTYAPHFKGAIPVDEAIRTLRATWERTSIDGGYGGAFISQFGDKQWV